MVPLLKETSLDNIRTLALKFFKSEGLETREFETWTRNENFRLLGGQISVLSSLEESKKSEENISKISQISTFEQLENLEISGKKVWSIEKTEALPSTSVFLIGSSLILNDFIKRLEISNVSKATIEVELSKRGLEKTIWLKFHSYASGVRYWGTCEDHFFLPESCLPLFWKKTKFSLFGISRIIFSTFRGILERELNIFIFENIIVYYLLKTFISIKMKLRIIMRKYPVDSA